MKFQRRRLTQLKVYDNNPRSNGVAVAKVKKSIQSYGYKVPIVIDDDDIIVAGHTRFAALLEIFEETGNYGEIDVVIADDLTDNQIKQFRIVDNQVAALAEWDFTRLRIELDSIEDFILEDYGSITGFDTELTIPDDIPEAQEATDKIKISIGGETIELTEAEFHLWCSYVIDRYNMSVLDFVRTRLELNSSDRTYSD